MPKSLKPSNKAKMTTSTRHAGGKSTSQRRGGTPSLDFARAQLEAALCHPDAHEKIPAPLDLEVWKATLKDRLQLKRVGLLNNTPDQLQDENLRDQILQKISDQSDAYAGKITSNVDLWAEVFIILQEDDIVQTFNPLTGDCRLGAAMMAAQQLVQEKTNAGLDSLGMSTAKVRWYLQYSDTETSLQNDLELTSHMLSMMMQMPTTQILGSVSTLFTKQQAELQQLITKAAFLTNDLSDINDASVRHRSALMRMSGTRRMILDALVDHTVRAVTAMSATERLAIFSQPKPEALWPLFLQMSVALKTDTTFAARLQATRRDTGAQALAYGTADDIDQHPFVTKISALIKSTDAANARSAATSAAKSKTTKTAKTATASSPAAKPAAKTAAKPAAKTPVTSPAAVAASAGAPKPSTVITNAEIMDLLTKRNVHQRKRQFAAGDQIVIDLLARGVTRHDSLLQWWHVDGREGVYPPCYSSAWKTGTPTPPTGSAAPTTPHSNAQASEQFKVIKLTENGYRLRLVPGNCLPGWGT